MQKLRLLSLFSGCGGLDLGFEGNFNILRNSYNFTISRWRVQGSGPNFVKLPKTCFKTVFANDIREDAQRLWEEYFRRRNTYRLASIVDLVKMHQSGHSMFPDNIDIVTGGFPCNDFSISGLRKGFDSHKSHNGELLQVDEPTEENRGKLYMWMRAVVEVVNPKMFIAENVKGLVSMVDVKDIIEHDFSTIGDGFVVVPARVLHAADYGVPQSRERVIFYCFNRQYLTDTALQALTQEKIPPDYDPYPLPTHAETAKDNLMQYVTLRDAFVGLQEPNQSQDPSQQVYSGASFYGGHCQGQIEVNLNGLGPTIRAEHHGNIEFRRLSQENGGRYIDELNAGMQERRLTVRECARIQTFPDNYTFIMQGVSMTKAYTVIGNAVPPLLGFHIARRIQDLWEAYFI